MAQFIIVDKSTHSVVINRIDIPDETAQSWVTSILQSLDPSIELLAKNEPYARPTNDERISTVTQIEGYVDTTHPLYTQIKQWQLTYNVSAKSVDDISLVIDDLEAAANQSTIPVEKQLKYSVLALEYLYASLVDKRALTNKEQKIVDKFRKQAGKVATNHQVKLDKNNVLKAGTTPDLDSNWQNNDFGTEQS
jgi:hypothetical protein